MARMRVSVVVTGMEDVRAALRELGAAASKQPLADAAKLGAEVVLTEAQRIVPVVSGNLKRSLNSGIDTVTEWRAVAYVGTNQTSASYAKKIEFGGSRKAPKGYLRPPLVTHREEIKEAIVASLRSSMGLA